MINSILKAAAFTALGLAAGLLLSPNSGAENRRILKKKATGVLNIAHVSIWAIFLVLFAFAYRPLACHEVK